jgi:rubrerythrin
MVTLVGTQTTFLDAVKDLLELDYDAIEAYKAAIERIENQDYKSKLVEFKADHERHTEELSQLIRELGDEPPKGPSAKQYLTKGKVVIANLIGDNAILLAMKDNEEDTNTAYERLNTHKHKPDMANDVLSRGRADEGRHREWLNRTLNNK